MEEKNIVKQETERCVVCGRDTGIAITEPVDGRENYVYGCGQLCGACFATLRHDQHFFE